MKKLTYHDSLARAQHLTDWMEDLRQRELPTWGLDRLAWFRPDCLEANVAAIKDRLHQTSPGVIHYGALGAFARRRLCADAVCAACGRRPPEVKRLIIDHDHDSDFVRGVLCDRCNAALGAVAENPLTLQNLLEYLTTRTPKIDCLVSLKEENSEPRV